MPVLNLKNPRWIYEGTNPNLIEPIAPDVTNRAPKDVESNVKKVADRVLRDEYNENAIVLNEFTSYDSGYNYMKGDLVKDSDGNTFVSVADNNKNNGLSDDDYWKPYLGVMPNVLKLDRAPNNDDDKGYPVGQVCVNTDDNRTYMQTSPDADSPNWVEITNVGDTDLASQVVDSNITATANTYLLARTSDDTDDYTIKLPSSPADKDLVKIGDYDNNASNNPVHLSGNGKKIEGHDTVDLDVDSFLVEITWNEQTNQWVILNK